MAILENLYYAILSIAGVFGGLLITGFLLRIIRDIFSKRISSSLDTITAIIGVPIHEIGHLWMAYLFGCEVKEVKLLDFTSKPRVSGYVLYSHNRLNLLHLLGHVFIATGPIILATVLTWGLVYLNVNSWVAPVCALEMFSASYDTAGFWLSIMFILVIAPYATLSREDENNLAKSLIVVTLIVSVVFLIVNLFGEINPILITHILQFNMLFFVYPLILVPASLITHLIMFVLSLMFRRKGGN